jgi:sugar diacid utilization regulator
LETSRVPYDFDLHHVGMVGVGPGAEAAIASRTSGPSSLVVRRAEGAVIWGWLGRSDEFESGELEALASPAWDVVAPRSHPATRLAIGEPGRGLAGWRLSHHQARAALAVALRGPDPVVRYADVAMLATALKDELLKTSFQRIYLEPLEGGRDGGQELRRTLRAYFEADRNISAAAAAVGVTRQAVARRLRSAEELLGRPIAALGADLEIALRLDALAN